MPVHVAENMKRVQKAARELQQSLGRDASPAEIAQKLGDKTEEEVKDIISYLQSPVSLESPVGEDGEDSLGDMVEDRTETTPEEAMDILARQEEVKGTSRQPDGAGAAGDPTPLRAGGREASGRWKRSAAGWA